MAVDQSLKHLELNQTSNVVTSYRAVVGETNSRVSTLVVAFHGRFGQGSSGNSDAAVIMAGLAAGLAAWRPRAVVIDLKDLEYEWGDGRFTAFALARTRDLDPIPATQDGAFPLAVVVGPKSEAGFRKIRNEPRWVFTRLSDALQHVGE